MFEIEKFSGSAKGLGAIGACETQDAAYESAAASYRSAPSGSTAEATFKNQMDAAANALSECRRQTQTGAYTPAPAGGGVASAVQDVFGGIFGTAQTVAGGAAGTVQAAGLKPGDILGMFRKNGAAQPSGYPLQMGGGGGGSGALLGIGAIALLGGLALVYVMSRSKKSNPRRRRRNNPAVKYLPFVLVGAALAYLYAKRQTVSAPTAAVRGNLQSQINNLQAVLVRPDSSAAEKAQAAQGIEALSQQLSSVAATMNGLSGMSGGVGCAYKDRPMPTAFYNGLVS